MAKVKHYAEFKSSNGTYYKIEIWDEDYTGTTPDEFKVTGKGFDLTYSGQTDDIYSPIIGSSVSFGMYVEGAAQVAFISALRQYQQDRFYVRIKRGATEAAATYYWSGYIVQDIVEIEDVSKPYVFEIQATDGISKLKDTLCGTSFFRKSTNQFLNALSQAGALGIYDTTDEVLAVVMNWWAEEMTYSTTTNPLDETWLDFHAFDTIDEDGFYTNKNWYEILAQVCTIFGLRFYFSNGQYRLEQIFQRDVASMTEHVYQKDGTKASSGTVSYERTINQTSGKAKLAGNIYNFLPAVNDVSITLNQEPKAMTGVTWDNSNDPDLELGLVSSALQNQLTLDFNHQIKLFLTTNVNQNPIYAKLRLNVELFDFNNNVTYYLKRTYSGMTPSAVSWTTTQAGSGYEIIVGTFREFSAQVTLGGTDVIQVGGPTSIVTPPIPEDGDLSLNWDFVSFVESNGSVRGLNIGNSSTYKMTLQSVTTSFGSIQNQTTTIRAVSPNADINGSVSYELPQTNIFTGQGERGSLVKQTNVGGLLIKVPYGNWREGNSGSYVEVQKLICQEFLKLMDEPVQKYAGSFFSDHDFRQRLTFDSKAWVQLGGTFSANNDEWDGEWFVINLASVVPVFDDGVNVGTSSVGGVGGNSFNGNTGFTGIDVVTLDVGGEAEVGGSVDIGGGLDVTGTSTLGTTDVGNFTTTDQVNVTINEIDATASGTTTIEGRNNTNFISWSGGAGSHVLNLPSSENGMVLNFHVDDTITEEKKIVLTPQTGELIDGDSTYTIETGLEDITLLAYDSNWFLSGATGTQGTVEKLHVSIRNDEGAILPAGTPIYSKGEIGGSERILVGKADASTSAKMPCIGITTEQLAVDADGLAIVTGIYNTNISGFTGLSVGDIMYVANGGGLTKTKPTGSDLIQNVGIILKTNGTIIQGFNVSAIGRTNDVPNLTTGKVWVGTATNTSESGVVHLDETNTRLGVNNTTPSKTLDVDGDALVSGGFQVSLSAGDEFKINPSDTDREWYIDTTNADHLKKERNMVLSADPDNVHASTTIGFRIDNSTLMQLNSSGNLGIGTTSHTEKLHVAGKISNDQFQIPNTAGTSGQILQWPSTGTTLEWADAGGGSTFTGALGGGASNFGFGTNVGNALTTGRQNTIIGAYAGDAIDTGYYNTLLGYDAGGAITSGRWNTIIGADAGDAITTGMSNVALGSSWTLSSLTTGSNNVAIGSNTARNMTTPSYNIGIGASALKACTTGSSNVAIGFIALTDLTTGSSNVSFGIGSGQNITTGRNNVINGGHAASNMTTGRDNVAIGYNAAKTDASNANVTYARYGVYIGYDAHPLNSSSENEIVIGYDADGNGSDSITLGNSSISSFRCYADLENPSDERLKKNIKGLPYGLEEVKKMNAVEYDMKVDDRHDIGFIAQELEKIIPDVVSKGGDDMLSIKYAKLVPVLVNAIKDLSDEVESLKEKLNGI